MDSRMSKYNASDKNNSRVKRNQEKYDNLSKTDLENFNVLSNATIIGESKKNEINIDKIKKILDNKYNEMPKRKSIRLDTDEESKYTDPEFENTKEYDINTILNKARSEKEDNYEQDRLKKIRDTQFNILSNLAVEKEIIEAKEESSPEKNNLMNLINTIAINEKKLGDKDINSTTMSLFAELKGSDKTEVIDPVSKTGTIVESIDELKNNEVNSTSKIDAQKDFYTSSTKFNKKDFEDLGIEEKGHMNIITIILVIIILLAFLAGMFIFLRSVFNF